MIPLRDENPTRTFPIIVVLLIAANTGIYIYQSLLPDLNQLLFVYTHAAIPTVLLGKTTVLQAIQATQPEVSGYLASRDLAPQALSPVWLTIFTAMFLHGGWLHLGGNMLFLWVFGNNVEDLLGHFRFLIFYLVCGLIAAAAQIALSLDSPLPMLGASGAIAGVLGAYYLRFPQARVLTLVWLLFFIRVVYLPASLLLFIWFFLQLVQGASSLGSHGLSASGGVAVFAHVGGFVAGWLLIRVFAPHDRRPRRIEWD